jgi:hypothetical protein
MRWRSPPSVQAQGVFGGAITSGPSMRLCLMTKNDDMEFRSPYLAPYLMQSRESWSEWQDLDLRPPRPEQGVLCCGASSNLGVQTSLRCE